MSQFWPKANTMKHLNQLAIYRYFHLNLLQSIRFMHTEPKLPFFIFNSHRNLYHFHLNIHLSIIHSLISMFFIHLSHIYSFHYNQIYGSSFFKVPNYTFTLHLSWEWLWLMEFFELEFYFVPNFLEVSTHSSLLFRLFINFKYLLSISTLAIYRNLAYDAIIFG